MIIKDKISTHKILEWTVEITRANFDGKAMKPEDISATIEAIYETLVSLAKKES